MSCEIQPGLLRTISTLVPLIRSAIVRSTPIANPSNSIGQSTTSPARIARCQLDTISPVFACTTRTFPARSPKLPFSRDRSATNTTYAAAVPSRLKTAIRSGKTRTPMRLATIWITPGTHRSRTNATNRERSASVSIRRLLEPAFFCRRTHPITRPQALPGHCIAFSWRIQRYSDRVAATTIDPIIASTMMMLPYKTTFSTVRLFRTYRTTRKRIPPLPIRPTTNNGR